MCVRACVCVRSVADEVSSVGDQRRVEGHLKDAQNRYLRALNVQPDHLVSYPPPPPPRAVLFCFVFCEATGLLE